MSPTRRARPRAASRLAAGAAIATLAGCGAPMEIFSSASDAAARISRLTSFMIIVAAVVYATVMAIMIAAMVRNRRRPADAVDLTRRGHGWIVWGGAVMPAVVLSALFIVSLSAMGRFPAGRPVVTVRVDGEQWWWRATYEFPDLEDRLVTANELHLPVGVPVRLLLSSKDVIHSFWVPQLQGKIDLIPGDTNELRLVARQPGTFYGQCAEFCGMEHAKMRVVVVAEDTATFRQWARHQLAPAAVPADTLAREGQRLFVGGPCAMCHTVRGTPALADVAPDLTHVGSRLTIAAGTLPNTPGNLEAWIANAQSLKPGARMPTLTGYSGRELRAVAAYVSSLK